MVKDDDRRIRPETKNGFCGKKCFKCYLAENILLGGINGLMGTRWNDTEKVIGSFRNPRMNENAENLHFEHLL